MPHPRDESEVGDRAIARNRAGELTIGVIDLLFKSQKGWEVRDYKTDVFNFSKVLSGPPSPRCHPTVATSARPS